MFNVLFTTILFATSTLAIIYGKTAERLTAVTLIAASFASPIVEKSAFQHVELGTFAVDLWVGVFLLTLALQSDRFWQIWAAAFQMVGLLIHVLRMLVPTIHPFAYSTMSAIWAYPVSVALFIGTLFEARKRLA